MREHDSRIALRLPSKERRQIERLIQEGRFRNLSQVIRAALGNYLNTQEESQ